MRLHIVRNLIAHAGLKCKRPAIFQLGFEFSFKAEEYVTFRTPMIRTIAGRVLHNAHSDVAELPRAPIGRACLSLVLSRFNLRPVCDSKGDISSFASVRSSFALNSLE